MRNRQMCRRFGPCGYRSRSPRNSLQRHLQGRAVRALRACLMPSAAPAPADKSRPVSHCCRVAGVRKWSPKSWNKSQPVVGLRSGSHWASEPARHPANKPGECPTRLRSAWIVCTPDSKGLDRQAVALGLLEQVSLPQHDDLDICLTQHGRSLGVANLGNSWPRDSHTVGPVTLHSSPYRSGSQAGSRLRRVSEEAGGYRR
jgi:hypothetical protein